MSRKFGVQPCILAGFENCSGDCVVYMDADLQDPPELMTDMMFMMDRGFEVVYGRRAERRGETMFKRATAHMFYRVLNAMSN